MATSNFLFFLLVNPQTRKYNRNIFDQKKKSTAPNLFLYQTTMSPLITSVKPHAQCPFFYAHIANLNKIVAIEEGQELSCCRLLPGQVFKWQEIMHLHVKYCILVSLNRSSWAAPFCMFYKSVSLIGAKTFGINKQWSQIKIEVWSGIPEHPQTPHFWQWQQRCSIKSK